MGQLFNRLKNFAKTQLNDYSSADAAINEGSDDDDLKRLIDEASKNTGKKESNYRGNADVQLNAADLAALRVLGLERNASISEIKSAYKKLVKKYHPDLSQGLSETERKAAEMKTAEINKAYEHLERTYKF